MKKAIIIVAIVAAAAVICTLLILRGWPGGLIGSGNLETEEYAFTDFTKVEISTAFEFEIEQSSSYNISVTADDNVMEYVQVSQDGQTLKIGLKTVTWLGPVTLRASVTMPQLRGLTVSGASRGTVSDFSSTEDLDITVSGASRVTGDITAGNVDFGISGASTIQLEGSANDIDANVSGASRLNLDNFTVNNADVNFSGASSGTVNLNGRLDANISGASRLWYIGEPTMGTINTSGASTISKK
ncbi:MAG TPA: head GIN domain-containing protein [Dehalococcoidia bacterium]|nr:head GIN domain-containing protein [Dehalococcoidia bacterium]